MPAKRIVEWAVSDAPVPYEPAVRFMEERASAIRVGTASEMIWLLEHPPLYTAGVRAAPEDLLTPERFPVYRTSRGGQFTYHGPGQRVAYVMLDLAVRRPDVRAFVCLLEDWLIDTLAQFDVIGERRAGRPGVWVRRSGGEAKIAALGVRVRRWVSFHGVSLNVRPDLSHFAGIVPCGIREHGVTSLVALGVPVTMAEVDTALKASFERTFEAVRPVPGPL